MSENINFCVLKAEEKNEILNVIMKANINTFPLLVHKYQTI